MTGIQYIEWMNAFIIFNAQLMHDLILIYARIFFSTLGIVCSYFIHKGSVEYFFEPYPRLL